MNSYFFLGISILVAAIIFFLLFRKFRFQQVNKEKDESSLVPSLVPPSSLSRNGKHDVFPSFHGADVRKTILTHILKEFRSKGIDSFIDNDMERSKSIGPELIEAIRRSKIAIVLISRKYASSSWCLNELVEIMKCREELCQNVMTVFYQVDPTDVKKQTGEFGKVFKKTCKGKTEEEAQKWRKALEGVATIAGYHSSKWDNEAAMIENIAIDVSNMLNHSTLSRESDILVGMGAHMKKIDILLRLDLDEVRMIGIWGPSGIGKSTIARALYNQISPRFQLKTIMVNIKGCYPRPCLDEYNAQLQLQNQMLSQMINQKDIMLPHLDVVKERLRDKKVLVVLDDVDRLAQLDALAKDIRWFGLGSRIIITTEDLRVLKAHEINQIYKVDFPSTDDALQIFCINAFDQKSPKAGFAELSYEVTYLSGKLPLGLKVMGSYFRGMSKKEWIKALPILRNSLDGEIKSILKFSYDALCDEYKDLFLHIACIFNRASIEGVEEHLAHKFLDVRQGLHVLAEKSLISIKAIDNIANDDGYIEMYIANDDGYIEMHNLLVQLGREIASHEPRDQSPGKRKFLVDARDICEVLTDDTGSGNVISINIDLSELPDKLNISERAFEGMSNLKFLRFNCLSGDQLSHKVYLPQGLDYLSRKLRFLQWTYFPMTCLPSNFCTDFLIELELWNSKLHKLWEGNQSLGNLKWMYLSGSKNLKEVPDLSTATQLQKLDLSYCLSLVELSSSIGNAINLQKLNLRNCSSLLELPSSIGNATNLQKLDISYCSSLVELPSSIGNATNLQKLDISHCSSLVELPSSIGNATNLQKLDISHCSSLVELPSSIGNATNLQKLDISHCSSLVELPSSIGNATNLEKLDLSRCSSLVRLPSSIGNATYLKYLRLKMCTSLVELPSSIGNLHKLSHLNLKGCSKLEVLPTFINLESLQELDLTDCFMLKSFPEITTNIKHLELMNTAEKEVCSLWFHFHDLIILYNANLKVFPHAFDNITVLDLTDTEIQELGTWIKGCSHLHQLLLSGCRNLKSLPQLPDSLYWLNADNCESLEKLECSFHNPKIHLNFANCFKLNQEARDLIIEASLYEVAVLPGTEVPAYFTYRASGSSVTVKLNQKPLRTSKKFKACILLVNKDEHTTRDWTLGEVSCSVTSKQNAIVASRTSNKDRLCIRFFTKHLYTFNVEAEEVSQVTSTNLAFKFKLHDYSLNKTWKIKNCGIVPLLHVDEHYESSRDAWR